MAEPMFYPGDRVRIFQKLPGHWNPRGEMDHWLGQVVTIRYCIRNDIPAYRIEEDQKEHEGVGWVWREDCLEPYTDHPLSEADLEMLIGGE